MKDPLIFYHYPRCKHSRKGLQYLRDHDIPCTVVEYMVSPLDEAQLRMILLKLNRKPVEIVRTRDTLFQRELKGKQFTEDEWIKILLEHPALMLRPIVVAKHKAVVAIPPEKIDGLL